MTRERTIHAAIKKWLKSEGWITWKNHGSAFSEGGLPDLMALRGGVLLAIEVKRPGYEPSALQSLWLRRINEAGGIGFCAISVSDAGSQLTRMLAERAKEEGSNEDSTSNGGSCPRGS